MSTTLGLCVHEHCPFDEPHWHGGIYRSGHIRSLRECPEGEKSTE